MLGSRLSLRVITVMVFLCSWITLLFGESAGVLDKYKELVAGWQKEGTPVIYKKVTIDELPFKNNHQRNLTYAGQLYDAGEREVAIETYGDMILAYAAAQDLAKKADVHETLAYIFYDKDKKWEAETRSAEEQKAWTLSRNLEAVSELTEFLRCFAKTDLTQHPKTDERYDKNFRQIILCFEENKAWTMALDWMDKYEAFRNPKSVTYNDRVDMIQYKKAEY